MNGGFTLQSMSASNPTVTGSATVSISLSPLQDVLFTCTELVDTYPEQAAYMFQPMRESPEGAHHRKILIL